MREAERLDIEVYGLGLGNAAVRNLLPHGSVVITNLAELPGKLFWLLEKAMKQHN